MKNYDDKDLAIVGFIALAIVTIIMTGEQSFELVEKIVIAIAGFVTGTGIRNYTEKRSHKKKVQKKEPADDLGKTR